MKLYLSAISNTGYKPAWIQTSFQHPKHPNGLTTLRMGVSGIMDYEPNTLHVQTEGDLHPRTLVKPNGENVDLSKLFDTELYLDLFNDHIRTAHTITVGVEPTDKSEFEELGQADSFANCFGLYSFTDSDDNSRFVSFQFDVEIV